MKKSAYVVFMIVSMFFAGQFAVQADEFSEGIEYKKIDQQRTESGDKIEVLEFFWYGCPHCYHFEPSINRWKITKPENVVFTRVPAIFRPDWKVQARAYYALSNMGVIEKMHGRIFDEIHKHKKPLNTREGIADFVAANGVDRDKFIEEYNSFTVDGQVRKALKKQKAYNISGVPTVAVNGKYMTNGTMAGDYPTLIKVIDYLVEKESEK